MQENIHDGHRKRMRDKFLDNGLDIFTDVEVLEILLFYAVPYKETNTIAHELIDKYGSLWGVMQAEYNSLMQIKGVGENTASLISFIPELFRRCKINQNTNKVVLNSISAAARVVQPYLMGKKVEELYLFCLTTKKTLIRVVPLQKGTVDSVQMYSRHIIGEAIINNAHSVILAHNHPSGSANPSKEDIEKTIQMQQSLKSVNIELIDHFIVCDNEYISLKRAGVITEDEQFEQRRAKDKVVEYVDD